MFRGNLIRGLLIAGLIGMAIGALDPLEGSVVILAGSTLTAVAALLLHGRYRVLLCGSFLLIASGVAAMFGLSAVGGFGGNTGRSNWWWLAIVPYPIGWIMGLAGALLLMRHLRAAGK